jgi:5'-deoxynucleotidase
MYRLRHIKRWSLMRNTTRENVAEHSFHVALLAHLLCEIGNRVFGRRLNADRAAAMALFHDATEVFTGDIPTPVKHHNPRVLESFREIEALAAERLAAMVPEPLRDAYAPLLQGKTWQRFETGEGGMAAGPQNAGTGQAEGRSAGNEAFLRTDGRTQVAESSRPADDPDAELRKYLKAADLLDAYLKCTVELASGNREFAVAQRQLKASLDKLALPEAEWFLEHFAPSFNKTLDELSEDH